MAEQTFKPVTAAEIVESAKQYAEKGFRLVQIHCTKTSQEMFLIYTFEKLDLSCENLKMDVKTEDIVPSISGIFFGALLYENETHDLYGIKFSDMLVDYQGTFYETSIKQPFAQTSIDDNK